MALFHQLNGVEKRECTHFLNSPYFNQRTDVLGLWHCLLRLKQREPDPPQIFTELYPGTPFDEAQWRYVQTFLLQGIEHFLTQRAWEQAPLLADLHLIPVFRRKKADKALAYALQRAHNKLAQLPQDKDFFLYQYLLEWEKYVSTESQHRTGANNLASVNRALDTFLVSSKLRLACLMESHKAVYQATYDLGLLTASLAHVRTSGMLEIPVVALYYHCYQALTTGNEADFRAFRRELEQHPELPPDERRTFLLLAVNYCIKRLNTGQAHYIREAFDLYKIGLETEVLIENGVLSRFAYKNIVALGLRLEAFDWVRDFIARYESLLEEKYRSANRDYNLARLFFTQKNYAKAMPLLAQVDESDLLLNLDSRVMLLKMYYETGEYEALDALLTSFRVLLLRKKKIIGYHQQHYLATLRLVKKLARLRPNDTVAVQKFKAEVTKNEVVLEKDWLLRQV